MATFIIYSYSGANDLDVLNGAEGIADGTSVTYTDPAYAGLVLTVTGTGITGTPSAAWNITGISATFNGHPAWSVTGLTGVDGTPTTGPFDPESIFQAIAFHNVGDLLLGHDSTLIGSPIARATWIYGHGGNDVLVARAGFTLLDGGDGSDTLIGASIGHDVFKFDSWLGSDNVDTIRGFSPPRDTIELDRGTFDNINHFGALRPAEFHSGLGAPSRTGADIVYNHNNGHLYYDSNGSHLGGLQLFAIVANHAALTVSDFLVI